MPRRQVVYLRDGSSCWYLICRVHESRPSATPFSLLGTHSRLCFWRCTLSCITAEKVASRRARIWPLARISLELFLQKYKDSKSNSVLGRNSFFFSVFKRLPIFFKLSIYCYFKSLPRYGCLRRIRTALCPSLF